MGRAFPAVNDAHVPRVHDKSFACGRCALQQYELAKTPHHRVEGASEGRSVLDVAR